MTEEHQATDLLRRRILICSGGSLAVTMLPSMLAQIRAVVPEAPLRVVLTENAAQLMPPASLTCLTDAPVFSSWPIQKKRVPTHIELATWADILLVMPATANLLAKAAYGIADDLVTTTLIATDCPILFVPSMNERMWQNPIVQDNVIRLRHFGRHVIDPDIGVQASTANLAVGAIPPLRDLLRAMLAIVGELERSP